MKIEAITLREIQMPLIHFFETSFGRVYSRRILLIHRPLRGHQRMGRMRSRRRSLLQQRVDRERLAYDHAPSRARAHRTPAGTGQGRRLPAE